MFYFGRHWRPPCLERMVEFTNWPPLLWRFAFNLSTSEFQNFESQNTIRIERRLSVQVEVSVHFQSEFDIHMINFGVRVKSNTDFHLMWKWRPYRHPTWTESCRPNLIWCLLPADGGLCPFYNSSWGAHDGCRRPSLDRYAHLSKGSENLVRNNLGYRGSNRGGIWVKMCLSDFVYEAPWIHGEVSGVQLSASLFLDAMVVETETPMHRRRSLRESIVWFSDCWSSW